MRFYHINYSSFTLINDWWREFNLSSHLSEFLSVYVRLLPASHEPANYKKESFKWTVFFREIYLFFPSYSRVFFLIISVFFSRNFCIIFFSQNFSFFRETDRSKTLRKNENFLFRRKTLVQSHNIISKDNLQSRFLTAMFLGTPCSCFQSFVRLRFVYLCDPSPLWTINSKTLFCIKQYLAFCL